MDELDDTRKAISAADPSASAPLVGEHTDTTKKVGAVPGAIAFQDMTPFVAATFCPFCGMVVQVHEDLQQSRRFGQPTYRLYCPVCKSAVYGAAGYFSGIKECVKNAIAGPSAAPDITAYQLAFSAPCPECGDKCRVRIGGTEAAPSIILECKTCGVFYGAGRAITIIRNHVRAMTEPRLDPDSATVDKRESLEADLRKLRVTVEIEVFSALRGLQGQITRIREGVGQNYDALNGRTVECRREMEAAIQKLTLPYEYPQPVECASSTTVAGAIRIVLQVEIVRRTKGTITGYDIRYVDQHKRLVSRVTLAKTYESREAAQKAVNELRRYDRITPVMFQYERGGIWHRVDWEV